MQIDILCAIDFEIISTDNMRNIAYEFRQRKKMAELMNFGAIKGSIMITGIKIMLAYLIEECLTIVDIHKSYYSSLIRTRKK